MLKRGMIYLTGFVLIAIAVSLHYKHNLGSAPFDAFTMNLASLSNIKVGYISIICNLSFVVLYFIRNKNKDIFISLAVVFSLGLLVNFFTYNVFNFYYDNIVIRFLLFVLATNICALGVAFILYTKLSMMPFECFVNFINSLKPFKKYQMSRVRVVIESSFGLVAMFIGLLFLKGFAAVGIATIFLMFGQAPLITLYLKLSNKVFKEIA